MLHVSLQDSSVQFEASCFMLFQEITLALTAHLVASGWYNPQKPKKVKAVKTGPHSDKKGSSSSDLREEWKMVLTSSYRRVAQVLSLEEQMDFPEIYLIKPRHNSLDFKYSCKMSDQA